jgi:hypothetical protein
MNQKCTQSQKCTAVFNAGSPWTCRAWVGSQVRYSDYDQLPAATLHSHSSFMLNRTGATMGKWPLNPGKVDECLKRVVADLRTTLVQCGILQVGDMRWASCSCRRLGFRIGAD